MRVGINVDDAGVRRVLDRMAERARNLAPAMREIGSNVVADAQMRFKAGKDPYGAAWKPLSGATLLSRARQRAGKGGIRAKNGGLRKGAQRIMASAKPLLDTGRLRNSITYRLIGRHAVEIGSNVEYAAIHQFGGMAGRGRKVKIPARPYLATRERGLPREYGEIIRDALARHFAKAAA